MADNYCQFSIAVEMTAEEHEWCRKAVEACEEAVGAPGLAEGQGEPVVDPVLARAVACMRADHGSLGFSFQEDKGGFVFFSEEYGSPEALGEFLSAFLARWRTLARLNFTWADTCSKMRPDEFSGGSVEVTAREVVALGASTAADALLSIQEILWPAGDEDRDWSADELPEIASVLTAAGLGPRGAP